MELVSASKNSEFSAQSSGTESMTAVAVYDLTRRISFINFMELTENFLQLMHFLEMARNGAALSLGENDLLIRIETIFKDVAEQCSESVALLRSFESTCEIAVKDADICYSYLKEEFDELALKSFEQLIHRSSEMEEKSTRIAEEFSQLSKKVDKEVCQALQMVDFHKQEVTKLLETKKKIDEAKKKLKEDFECVQGNERCAKEDLRISKEELDKDGLLKKVFRYFNKISFSFVLQFSIETKESDEVFHTTLQKIRAKAMEVLSDMRREKDKIYRRGARLATKESAIKKQITTSSEISDAFESIYGLLKSLNASMLHFARFWKDMKDSCSDMTRCSKKEKETNQLLLKKYQRSAVIHSIGFEKSHLKFCGAWKYLSMLCRVAKEQLEDAEKKVYDALKRVPKPLRKRVPSTS